MNKIFPKIKLIKFTKAKGKINENRKRSEREEKKKKVKLGLALKRWQKFLEEGSEIETQYTN